MKKLQFTGVSALVLGMIKHMLRKDFYRQEFVGMVAALKEGKGFDYKSTFNKVLMAKMFSKAPSKMAAEGDKAVKIVSAVLGYALFKTIEAKDPGFSDRVAKDCARWIKGVKVEIKGDERYISQYSRYMSYKARELFGISFVGFGQPSSGKKSRLDFAQAGEVENSIFQEMSVGVSHQFSGDTFFSDEQLTELERVLGQVDVVSPEEVISITDTSRDLIETSSVPNMAARADTVETFIGVHRFFAELDKEDVEPAIIEDTSSDAIVFVAEDFVKTVARPYNLANNTIRERINAMAYDVFYVSFAGAYKSSKLDDKQKEVIYGKVLKLAQGKAEALSQGKPVDFQVRSSKKVKSLKVWFDEIKQEERQDIVWESLDETTSLKKEVVKQTKPVKFARSCFTPMGDPRVSDWRNARSEWKVVSLEAAPSSNWVFAQWSLWLSQRSTEDAKVQLSSLFGSESTLGLDNTATTRDVAQHMLAFFASAPVAVQSEAEFNFTLHGIYQGYLKKYQSWAKKQDNVLFEDFVSDIAHEEGIGLEDIFMSIELGASEEEFILQLAKKVAAGHFNRSRRDLLAADSKEVSQFRGSDIGSDLELIEESIADFHERGRDVPAWLLEAQAKEILVERGFDNLRNQFSEFFAAKSQKIEAIEAVVNSSNKAPKGLVGKLAQERLALVRVAA